MRNALHGYDKRCALQQVGSLKSKLSTLFYGHQQKKRARIFL